MDNTFVITLDIDWAPDFVIDAVAEHLINKKVKATWFVTHQSNAVRRLQEESDLFEIGLHPNLTSGSTHGNDPYSVMKSVKKLAPESRIMRTHGLMQSTSILALAAKEFDISIDVSLFLPGTANLTPHRLPLNDNGAKLIRIPYFWEDDIESYRSDPSWSLFIPRNQVQGLKVFDFHPIHVYLNSESMSTYEKLKRERKLVTNTVDDLSGMINKKNSGTATMFRELVDHIATKQEHSYSITDIADGWQNTQVKK